MRAEDDDDVFTFDDRSGRYHRDWTLWAHYIAQDMNGRWHAYSVHPEVVRSCCEWQFTKNTGAGQWSYLWTTAPHPNGWENTAMNLYEITRTCETTSY